MTPDRKSNSSSGLYRLLMTGAAVVLVVGILALVAWICCRFLLDQLSRHWPDWLLFCRGW